MRTCELATNGIGKMTDKITCLLCNISESFELLSSTPRDDPSGEFKVVRCLTCGHVQLSPLPSLDVDTEFYKNNGQTRNLMGETDILLWNTKATIDTARRVQWLHSVMPAKDGGEVLDVGCGYGTFVDAITKAGYLATGLDIGEERLKLAKAHQNGTFIQGAINENFVKKNCKRFHVVTSFHVLEHIQDPVTYLTQLSELVALNGYLLIEVPNLADELLDHSEKYRAFYWQRAHLSYFDAARLELAFRRAGFKHFSIHGVQRYGLRNLLHWIDKGKPQLTNPTYQASDPIIRDVEEQYNNLRERSLTCDTLAVEVKI